MVLRWIGIGLFIDTDEYNNFIGSKVGTEHDLLMFAKLIGDDHYSSIWRIGTQVFSHDHHFIVPAFFVNPHLELDRLIHLQFMLVNHQCPVVYD